MEFEIYKTDIGTWLLRTEGCIVSEATKGGAFWEAELKPVFERIKPDDIVVEVGGYVGEHTVLLARKCKEVHVFEAYTPNYYQLCANILLNECFNVKTYNMCMGEFSSKANLRLPPHEWTMACTRYIMDTAGDTQVYALDTVLAGLDRLDYLKVDCEGLDLEIMMGAKTLITRYKPIITYEVNSPHSTATADDFEKYINSLGYTVGQIGQYNWLAEPK